MTALRLMGSSMALATYSVGLGGALVHQVGASHERERDRVRARGIVFVDERDRAELVVVGCSGIRSRTGDAALEVLLVVVERDRGVRTDRRARADVALEVAAARERAIEARRGDLEVVGAVEHGRER